MLFSEYYQNLIDKRQKQDLRNQITDLCKIQQSTFYSWLQRNKFPQYAQNIIAGVLNKDAYDLFIQQSNNNQ